MTTPHKPINARAAEVNRVTPAARDAGLARLKQMNRRLIAGAAGLTAVLALVVAGSSSGHSSAPSTPGAVSATSAAVPSPAASSGPANAGSAAASQPSVAPSAVVTGAS